MSERDTGRTFSGGCACGGVRYRMETPPMFVHCCHCRDCQRQTGSAFVTNALVETDRITLLAGSPTPVQLPTDSGRPHDVYRCADCGTALWSDYGRRPGLRFLRVGALDEPDSLAPDVHIFTRSKLAWVTLPKGARAYKIYYQMTRLWPAESLARRRAVVST